MLFEKLNFQLLRLVVRVPVQRFSTAETTCPTVGVEVPKKAVAPEVLEIGQIIRIQARDNIQVASVRVIIDNADGTIYEQGEAVQSDGLWWSYTTQSQVSQTPTSRIVATAQELPGNTSDLVWQNN